MGAGGCEKIQPARNTREGEGQGGQNSLLWYVIINGRSREASN